MCYLDKIAEQIWATLPDQVRIHSSYYQDLYRIYAVLALSAAPIRNQDVHNAWVAWQLTCNGMHPAITSYDKLAPSVQDLDIPFQEAIARTQQALNETAVNS